MKSVWSSSRAIAAVVASAVLVSIVGAQDLKTIESPLVKIQKGDLPIVISAPHGGIEKVLDVAPRKGAGLEKGGRGFFAGRDTNTELLAAAIADALLKKTEKKPYLVIAKFHRKYIDANRPPKIAYEDDKAKPTYDAFHGNVTAFCKDVQRRFGRGLLLDVHGQGSKADTIFRGTNNGKTVTLLTQRFGPQSHVGPKSFFGLLDAQGLKGHPLDNGKEQAGFTGGFIVQTYGGHESFGIDAIQLEFGGDYRNKAKIADAADKVAAAVVEFSKLYLPNEELDVNRAATQRGK